MPFAQHHAQKMFGLHTSNNLVENGDIVVLKRTLYGLETVSNSFRNLFGEFFVGLGLRHPGKTNTFGSVNQTYMIIINILPLV